MLSTMITFNMKTSKIKTKIYQSKNILILSDLYLSDIINNCKTKGERKTHSGNIIADYKSQRNWKILLTIAIKFISSKDSSETRNMHSKSDIEIMMGSETDEIVEELFEFLLKGYHEELEESMKGSEFIFDSGNVLYYNLNKISLNRRRSYIDSPEWLKNKKSTINPKNNDNKYFQYAVIVALNHKNIVKGS